MIIANTNSRATCQNAQRGMATLTVTLILLILITIMVLAATTVSFYEQKTATNENRARISQNAAEYAINLAGEWLKVNRGLLISDTAGSGWLAAGATKRWATCADAVAATDPLVAGHPCLSEPDLTRRAQLYFWTADGLVTGDQLLNYTDIVPAGARVEAGMGGASAYAATAEVRALLCRLDTSDTANVHCALAPVAGNRVALTLISDAALTNENGAKASVKETWATYSTFVPSATVPLIASGLVTGLGNGSIVASPDAHGDGSNSPASMWSPNNVDDGGSYITCQFAEFTDQLVSGEMTMTAVKTNCPSLTGGGGGGPCNCPKAPDENTTAKEDYSGHKTGGAAVFHKGNDILDVIDLVSPEPICDSTTNVIASGCRTLPSITFFPGPNATGTPMDRTPDDDDDSLFEYIFGVDYVAADQSADAATLLNCGTSGTQNCFDYAMREEFAAVIKTCADLNGASAALLSGIIYVPVACSVNLTSQIGSIDNPAIVVINQGNTTLSLKNGMLMYGMLFVHSDSQAAADRADVDGTMPQFFGSLVVEGDIKMTGQFLIVYDDTSSSSDTNIIPTSAKFGRVPGSWLDARTSF